VIEDKLGLKKLISETKDGIKTDEKSISAFAVNGAVWYARQMIASGKYKEVIAIGVAGDDDENVQISVYYVYGYSEDAVKSLPECQNFHFLENCNSKFVFVAVFSIVPLIVAKSFFHPISSLSFVVRWLFVIAKA